MLKSVELNYLLNSMIAVIMIRMTEIIMNLKFKKQMNMYIRLNNEKTEICRLLTGNAEFFFDRFLDAVDDSHGQTHHFNYAAWKEMRGYAQAAEASDDNP